MRHGFVLTVPLYLGIAFVLWSSVVDPQMFYLRHIPSFVAALGFASTAAAQGSDLADSIDAQWHAPAKFWDTDLDQTINAKGTYGFIFNSSSLPPGVKYGSYDYCNMPHVRKQEYKVPSKEYTLEYVEVIHRHHKRTPYSSNLVSQPCKRRE